MIKKAKTKTVTFRMSQIDFEKYLLLFKTSKIGKNKTYSISDFIRSSIFNKKIQNIKIIKTKAPSKCQKIRLQMLISTVKNIENIANILMIQHKNPNNSSLDVTSSLLQLQQLQDILKAELS